MNRSGLRFLAVAFLLLAGLVLDASQAAGRERPPRRERPSALAGGVLATFEVEGERFKVWVTNPVAIDALFALDEGSATASIPNGRLHSGTGTGRHNAPWHWYLDPNDIEIVDATTEVCDATPSYVEANRRDFIRSVGRYCPWTAELVALQDFR